MGSEERAWRRGSRGRVPVIVYVPKKKGIPPPVRMRTRLLQSFIQLCPGLGPILEETSEGGPSRKQIQVVPPTTGSGGGGGALTLNLITGLGIGLVLRLGLGLELGL